MKKVIASLKYGYLARESFGGKIYLIFAITFFSLIFIFTVSIMGCIIGGVVEAEDGLIGAIVGIDIIAIAFFVVAVCLLVYDKKVLRKIESWQDDFVETTATVTDESITEFMLRTCITYVKLKVEFKIDGKKYSKSSTFKNHKLPWLGCYGSMISLAASNVPIYYSKKYDQVVFIKWN